MVNKKKKKKKKIKAQILLAYTFSIIIAFNCLNINRLFFSCGSLAVYSTCIIAGAVSAGIPLIFSFYFCKLKNRLPMDYEYDRVRGNKKSKLQLLAAYVYVV